MLHSSRAAQNDRALGRVFMVANEIPGEESTASGQPRIFISYKRMRMARAGTVAALVLIALASGAVLAGLTQDPESRCSLVWSEGRLIWVLKASPQ